LENALVPAWEPARQKLKAPLHHVVNVNIFAESQVFFHDCSLGLIPEIALNCRKNSLVLFPEWTVFFKVLEMKALLFSFPNRCKDVFPTTLATHMLLKRKQNRINYS
jgi:hypothetical protein